MAMANSADRGGRSRGSFFRKLIGIRTVVGLAALVLAIVFIAENNQAIRIHFILFTAHTRLWVGFLVSLVLGALLGQAFFSFRNMRGRQSDKQASKNPVTPDPAGR